MNMKAKFEEYLEVEDILYLDIFMKNGTSFSLLKPNHGATLSAEPNDDYLKIYGDIDESNRIDTIVPYENISHITMTAGQGDLRLDEGEGEE